ncbi:MAG: hypothetical protein COA78_08825 [Blastopirellula sp.]|nr:MAG: hypothetical protein COA78_08825 [Blastopirellula sp.]
MWRSKHTSALAKPVAPQNLRSLSNLQLYQAQTGLLQGYVMPKRLFFVLPVKQQWYFWAKVVIIEIFLISTTENDFAFCLHEKIESGPPYFLLMLVERTFL